MTTSVFRCEAFGVDLSDDGTHRRALLRGISFDVTPGEIVAVTGPSGAGKTTLLRGFARLHRWTEGALFLGGVPAESIGGPAYRRQVHYVAQRPTFVDGSVRDALVFAQSLASAKGDREPFDDKTLSDALHVLDLEPAVLSQDVATLSEGERQRVAFVRSRLIAPRVMLLDEPTSALDRRARLRLEAQITAVCAEGAAVILVSHDEDQIGRLATRAFDISSHVVGAVAANAEAS